MFGQPNLISGLIDTVNGNITLVINGNPYTISTIVGDVDWNGAIEGPWCVGQNTQSTESINGVVHLAMVETTLRTPAWCEAAYRKLLGANAATTQVGSPLVTDVPIDANTDYEWRVTETTGTTVSNSGVAGVEPLSLGTGASLITGAESIYDSAINCPLSPSTALASSATDISFVAGTGLTVQAWVKPYSLQNNGCIVTRQYTDGSWSPSPYNAFYLGCLTNGGLLIQLATPGHNTISMNPAYGSAITLLDWNHVAFTYNPTTGSLVGYVNGRAIGSTTLSGNVSFGSATPGPLLVGGVPVLGATQKFDGAICRVRIEHTERSAAYMSKLYLRGQLKVSQ